MKKIAIGIQDFENIRTGNYFYVDKTHFIKEWWDTGDSVTLITRPRRFGKTLTMSMLETFFSVKYANRSDLFEGLDIWQEEYRKLQGTYPVINISFASIKEKDYVSTRKSICKIIYNVYLKNTFLLEGGQLPIEMKTQYQSIFSALESEQADDSIATTALHQLSKFLNIYYGKPVIILLDEYDTPMQEAYVQGYWQDLMYFIRSMFNATFKTNPYLARAIMTGITRVSKESVFSDLNNLNVVTTTSEEYENAFGFTEEEVFKALDEYGLSEKKQDVKKWYDGFVFGTTKDI